MPSKPTVNGRPHVVPLKRTDGTKPVTTPKPSLKNAPRRKPLPSREPPSKPHKSNARSPQSKGGKQGTKPGSKPPRNRVNPGGGNGVSGEPLKLHPETVEPGRPGVDPDCPIRALFPFANDYQFPDAGLKGRRPKITQLTAKTVAQLLLIIRIGGYDYQAAKSLGITHATWNAWKDRGYRDLEGGKSTPYSRFFIAVEKAQGEARISAELTVRARDPLS